MPILVILSYISSKTFSPHLQVNGGACPKNAPSGASTTSRVAQEADRALNCGLFGQPGGGYPLYNIVSNIFFPEN